MERTELLKNIREVLISAGFYVSDLYSMRLTGFDIVARRDDLLLIIKVLTNVDSLSEDVAKELRTLSSVLKATPLLIGEKNGANALEDDAVYFRFGVQAITVNTLKNHLLDGMPVKVYAAPGGLYVNLDEEELRMIRMEKNISIGSFARSVNVSRRTIRMYEEGMNASSDAAARIEELLGDKVTTPIDIFKPTLDVKQELMEFRSELENLKDFQRDIFLTLKKVGYKIIPVGHCPFEALSKDRDKLLLTSVSEYDKKLIKKARIVKSVSEITEKYAVLITDREISRTNIEGTPIIIRKELKKLKEPEQMFDLILERMCN